MGLTLDANETRQKLWKLLDDIPTLAFKKS